MPIRSPTVITSRARASGASSSSKVPGCHGTRSLSSASGCVEGEMPRRSLFCVSAPTGLVHWYQPRLGGAHLRPHVRTRRSTERGGGRDSGKSAQLAMFGVTAAGYFRIRPNRAQPSNRVCFLYNRKRLYRSPPSVRACQGGGSVQNKQKGCKTADGDFQNLYKLQIRDP